MVENFNLLSEDEQLAFATELMKKINSENIFTSDVDFHITDVEADELSGDLYIAISNEELFVVPRKATWQCDTVDDVNDGPGSDAEYENSVLEDAGKAFTTISAEVDGYKVTVEVDDVDEVDNLGVDVEDYTEEDDGIGPYEYWGHTGFDSRPYVEVTGEVSKGCICHLTLCVEPLK